VENVQAIAFNKARLPVAGNTVKMKRQDTKTCETGEVPDKPAPSYHAPALEKGLDILELLARSRKPMTLTRISETLNKASTELFRMIRVLERRDYIVLSEDRRGYVLTDKLSRLGMSHDGRETIVEYNLTAMRRIRELEEENTKLKRAVADLLLDSLALPDSKSR